MALASSHPFRLADPSCRRPKLVVHAKQNPPFSFKIGKRDEGKEAGSASKNRFGPLSFDFKGKLPEGPIKLPEAPIKLPVPVVSSGSLLGPGLRRKDPNTVFVAGATGITGTRIALTLLRQGYAVRAGVPDIAKAQELAQLAAKYQVISPEESKRLNAVESPLDDSEAIAKAIGNASKVVVTVGRGENGPAGEVTADDALEVIRGAQLSETRHVALVYDVAGTGLFGGGSTYNIIDGFKSFFADLFSPTQPLNLTELLSKVAELDVSCTVLKAPLTDNYAAEDGYGIEVSPEGSIGTTPTPDTFKVTKSQIASLVANIFSNVEAAENRVVEVTTSPSATTKTIEELFRAIPEDGRRKAYLVELQEKVKEEEKVKAEMKAKAEAEEKARTKAKAEAEEKARAKAKAEAEEKAKVEEERKIINKEVQQKKAPRQKFRIPDLKAAIVWREEVKPIEDLPLVTKEDTSPGARPKGLKVDFSWEKLRSQLSAVARVTNNSAKNNEEEESEVEVAPVRKQAKKVQILSPRKTKGRPLTPKRAPPSSPPPKKEKEMRNVLGGLFKQETIYIDDD